MCIGRRAPDTNLPSNLVIPTEDNERTNEVGLFNYADTYLVCGKLLIENRPTHLRFDAPIYFLLFHAAELYLKSCLRQKGEDVEALKGLGHYHQRMLKKAATFGLDLPPLTRDIFDFGIPRSTFYDW